MCHRQYDRFCIVPPIYDFILESVSNDEMEEERVSLIFIYFSLYYSVLYFNLVKTIILKRVI